MLLVAKAPRLRGGYVIDFWAVGSDIAEKMGLIPRLEALGYSVRGVRFVDRRGRKQSGVMVVRWLDEERYLAANLPGYDAYRQKARLRLIPWIW